MQDQSGMVIVSPIAAFVYLRPHIAVHALGLDYDVIWKRPIYWLTPNL